MPNNLDLPLYLVCPYNYTISYIHVLLKIYSIEKKVFFRMKQFAENKTIWLFALSLSIQQNLYQTDVLQQFGSFQNTKIF